MHGRKHHFIPFIATALVAVIGLGDRWPAPVSVTGPDILGGELDLAIVPNPLSATCTIDVGEVQTSVQAGGLIAETSGVAQPLVVAT